MGWQQSGLTVLQLNGDHGLIQAPSAERLPEIGGQAITVGTEDAEIEKKVEAVEALPAPLDTGGNFAGARPAEARVVSDKAGESDEKAVETLPGKLSELSPLFSSASNLAYVAEQYRIIRTRILQRLPGGFRLVITSPGIGDGKTVNAINLAAALARKSEGRTLLIDADMRRANVHRWMDLPISPGLAEVLSGECEAQDAIHAVPGMPSLLVMPSGKPRENASELLDSSRWRSLAEIVRRKFSQTIIDCPPVEVVADYDLIAAVCDGVVLVVRPDHTNRPGCFAALEKVRPKLTGVLVNEAREWFLWRRGTPTSYYYSSKYARADRRV